jgi:large subunit ribosomal protein L23
LLFEVSVDHVTVMNYQGKQKRHGMTRGRRASWKKAYVRLAEGSSIDFLGGE